MSIFGFSARTILIVILISTTFFHLFRLGYPNAYVFDEVYHAFTAREYVLGHKEAWEWWTTPPPGVAYEWTHPPLAKEIMAASMFSLGTMDPWAYRLPGALLGILSVYILYLLSLKLFNNQLVALISAFLFSIDGLNFVQSRTGMNDIYVVTFGLISLLFLTKKKFFLSSVFLGLALCSKWSALYLIIIESVLLFYQCFFKQIKLHQLIRAFIYIAIVLPAIYMISYIPFFLSGHDFSGFIELQRQMEYYHTHLKATHDYSSTAITWPLNLYPVWYYVEYHPNTWISNIFASGNPLLFWIGAGAMLVTLWDTFQSFFSKQKTHLHLLRDAFVVIGLGFFGFWLPWMISPRIMFLYHYSPSVPFMCMALSYQLGSIFGTEVKRSKLPLYIILAIAISFLLVYPFLTGIALPKGIMRLFFDTNLTKNPFG